MWICCHCKLWERADTFMDTSQFFPSVYMGSVVSKIGLMLDFRAQHKLCSSVFVCLGFWTQNLFCKLCASIWGECRDGRRRSMLQHLIPAHHLHLHHTRFSDAQPVHLSIPIHAILFHPYYIREHAILLCTWSLFRCWKLAVQCRLTNWTRIYTGSLQKTMLTL